MKILIGYDGSTCSDAALADLPRAGVPAGSTIRLLGVADFGLGSGENLSQAELFDRLSLACRPEFAHTTSLIHEMHRLSSQAERSLRRKYAQWNISGDVRVGSPAQILLETADEMNADLIVMGSHGGSGLHRWMFGSVVRSVLKDTRCPVRIVHREVPLIDRPPRLLVHVEAAALREQVKAIAQALSRHEWPADTEIRVLVGHGCSDEAIAESELIHTFTCHEKTPTILSATGLPDGELISHARLWQADSVFVGWRAGHHKLSDARFIETLLSHAHCAVEVAPMDSSVALAGGSG